MNLKCLCSVVSDFSKTFVTNVNYSASGFMKHISLAIYPSNTKSSAPNTIKPATSIHNTSIPSASRLKTSKSYAKVSQYDKMSHSKYVYKRDLSEQEEQVQRMGYPYVNTIKLKPSRALTPHAHNSENTHLIVQGELTMWDTKVSRRIGIYKVGKEIRVPANMCYRAEAGAEGCIFIEGHKDLSPTSADRFEDLGDDYQDASGGHDSQREKGSPLHTRKMSLVEQRSVSYVRGVWKGTIDE